MREKMLSTENKLNALRIEKSELENK